MITSSYTQIWYDYLRFSSVSLLVCCKWLYKVVKYRACKTNLYESKISKLNLFNNTTIDSKSDYLKIK